MIDARRLAIVALCGTIALVACSATLNVLAIRILAARHPVPGALVDIDGRAMHIYCVGKGTPTVVLESGAGDDWIYWQKVQPEASRASRVCTYDRGGLGWSDPRPGRRDAHAIAADLHRLLAAAGERPPYVMVGASAGALYARMFAATFPSGRHRVRGRQHSRTDTRAAGRALHRFRRAAAPPRCGMGVDRDGKWLVAPERRLPWRRR